MHETLKNASGQSLGEAQLLARPGMIALLRQSAIRALPEAVLVLVLGNLAVGIVGGIWHQMAPSPPPGIDGQSISSAGHSLSSLIRLPSIREHQFLIVYLIFLLHNLRLCWFGKPAAGETSQSEPWEWQTRRRFWRQWFRLIVVNAFGALFSAIALFWVQQFSLTQILWHAVLQPVFTQIGTTAGHWFGQSATHGIQSWVSWYGANQFKFNYWFLYIAAICDDLGVPNLKTLARHFWHRFGPKLWPSKPPQD